MIHTRECELGNRKYMFISVSPENQFQSWTVVRKTYTYLLLLTSAPSRMIFLISSRISLGDKLKMEHE